MYRASEALKMLQDMNATWMVDGTGPVAAHRDYNGKLRIDQRYQMTIAKSTRPSASRPRPARASVRSRRNEPVTFKTGRQIHPNDRMPATRSRGLKAISQAQRR